MSKAGKVLLNQLKAMDQLTVDVGWFAGSRYPDGTPVAQIASIMEYGATIKKEARTTTIYRSTDESGNLLNGGKFVKREKANLVTQHTVPAHTVVIPARPFMRRTAAEQAKAMRQGMEKGMQAASVGKRTPEEVMQTLGDYFAGQVQTTIVNGDFVGNAKSTIRAKGFDAPLRHSSLMSKSIEAIIRGRK